MNLSHDQLLVIQRNMLSLIFDKNNNNIKKYTSAFTIQVKIRFDIYRLINN